MSLTASIADHAVASRMRDAAAEGVSTEDIEFAMRSDVDPADVKALRETTRRLGLLLVIRCPKHGAAGWHGTFRAKRWADGHDSAGNLVKSGVSGVGVHPEHGNIFVSDYDMMSLWQRGADGKFHKVFASALQQGAQRGPWSVEGMRMVRWLNQGLRSPLQHGAQDDYTPPEGGLHPNVQPDTRFAAFVEGQRKYLRDAAACQRFYEKHGLHWPYDAAGKFTGARA